MNTSDHQNTEAAIKRQKRKDYERHWTKQRSEDAHFVAFLSHRLGGKSAQRKTRKVLLKMNYASFFADPKMQAEIRRHKLEWCINLHPRLVRDTVLGALR